jgi:hypothetical protein
MDDSGAHFILTLSLKIFINLAVCCITLCAFSFLGHALSCFFGQTATLLEVSVWLQQATFSSE